MATLTTKLSSTTTAANNTKPNSGKTISTQKLLWAAPLVGIIAAVVNSLIFLAYGATGIDGVSQIILPFSNPGTPVALPVVALVTFIPALGAGALLWALNKFTQRPIQLFTILAIIALPLSFGMSLFLDMPTISKIALDAMHVAAAVVIVGGLINLTKNA